MIRSFSVVNQIRAVLVNCLKSLRGTLIAHSPFCSNLVPLTFSDLYGWQIFTPAKAALVYKRVLRETEQTNA